MPESDQPDHGSGPPDPRAWGIEDGYHDVGGGWHPLREDTAAGILAAMGARTPAPPGPEGSDVWPQREDVWPQREDVWPQREDVWVVTVGSPVGVDGAWRLVLEDGTALEGHGELGQPLPLGYHRLERGHGIPVRLIVTPGACHPVGAGTRWGWACQLPSVRSRSSWGMGDLADLAELGRWTRTLGGSVVLLNPLHASLPGLPQQPSPYFSSSRCFRNPLYIRVEDVPGAAEVAAVGEAARAGRELDGSRVIDRDRVWELKTAVLEELWKGSGGRRGEEGFARFCERGGEALRGYATFCALSEVHGRGWPRWPEELRRPDGPAVARWAADHADRVGFHSWLQWLLDEQLSRAGEAVGLVQDLAIGADPDGADAWLWQDALALGVRVGAPPDEFNRAGQDWGFPPFDPWRLRRAGFEPWVQVVRAVLSHAAGVRIDHVAGLFRLFWIPPGMEAGAGMYVRYPWEEMLAILALESVRAGAWVVGEDLGTVEPFVREELARRQILSTRLVWFEPDPPECFPAGALAAVTTHDLPTVAGLWTGSDLADQRAAGVEPNEESTGQMSARVAAWAGLGPDAPVPAAVEGVHRLLARAPSAVRLATLEDALAVPERPNLPGTTEEARPNWSMALPVPLEDLESDPLALSLARIMGREA